MRVSSASGEWFEREMISLSTCLGHEVGDENGVFFEFWVLYPPEPKTQIPTLTRSLKITTVVESSSYSEFPWVLGLANFQILGFSEIPVRPAPWRTRHQTGHREQLWTNQHSPPSTSTFSLIWTTLWIQWLYSESNAGMFTRPMLVPCVPKNKESN